MSGKSVLVTGGAGYVGSFAVRALLAAGERVAVLDDLSRGHREAVPEDAALLVEDLRDAAGVRRAFATDAFDAVLHFAAYAAVSNMRFTEVTESLTTHGDIRVAMSDKPGSLPASTM